MHDLAHKFVAITLPFAASFLLCFWILRHDGWHKSWSGDASDEERKEHGVAIPRIGGFSIFLAAAIWFVLFGLDRHPSEVPPGNHLSWDVAVMAGGAVAFLAGILEDVTKRISATKRMLAICVGSVAVILLSGSLPALGHRVADSFAFIARLGVEQGVGLLIGVLFVAGVTNGFNMIDGANGLAAMTALMSAIAMSALLDLGDGIRLLLFALSGALLGFLLWNFPKGRIFLGDGGAYFVGMALGSIAILAISRTGESIDWAAAPILFYPLTEVFFTFLRRAFSGGLKRVFAPDSDHLHHRVFRSRYCEKLACILKSMADGIGEMSFLGAQGKGTEHWPKSSATAMIVIVIMTIEVSFSLAVFGIMSSNGFSKEACLFFSFFGFFLIYLGTYCALEQEWIKRKHSDNRQRLHESNGNEKSCKLVPMTKIASQKR